MFGTLPFLSQALPWAWDASPYLSPTRVMIVQAIEFTGVSVREGNARCIFDRSESAVGSSGCARARELVRYAG